MNRRPRGALRSARIRGRAFLRRLDRDTPDWMRWLTPWGTSLILHAGAIAVLGLLVYVNTEGPASRMILSDFPASQLTEDLTTLAPSDHAGDLFTTLTTPDPPSFSLGPRGAEN